MSIQTATTGQLENAQRIIIANVLYTAEHNRPTGNLLQPFTLGQGEKTLTVPKVAQFTAARLTDGVDMTEEQAIGMTTFDVSTTEVGLKVILTDKLARQENESVFTIVGKQGGDAMGRFMERDAITLFASLNGGTALGADNKNLTLDNLAACINYAQANKFGSDLVIVHHPNALFNVVQGQLTAASPRWTAPSLDFARNLLERFYEFSVNNVPVFQTGEIDKVSGQDSGYGAIFDRGALGLLTQKGLSTETQRDASYRATELVTVADYQPFEVDDARGAPLLYEIGAVSTAT